MIAKRSNSVCYLFLLDKAVYVTGVILLMGVRFDVEQSNFDRTSGTRS